MVRYFGLVKMERPHRAHFILELLSEWGRDFHHYCSGAGASSSGGPCSPSGSSTISSMGCSSGLCSSGGASSSGAFSSCGVSVIFTSFRLRLQTFELPIALPAVNFTFRPFTGNPRRPGSQDFINAFERIFIGGAYSTEEIQGGRVHFIEG